MTTAQNDTPRESGTMTFNSRGEIVSGGVQNLSHGDSLAVEMRDSDGWTFQVTEGGTSSSALFGDQHRERSGTYEFNHTFTVEYERVATFTITPISPTLAGSTGTVNVTPRKPI